MRDSCSCSLLAASAVIVLAALSCSSGAEPSPSIASVQVNSAVDTILALGRTAQLTATARDQSGKEVAGAQFTWESSSSAVVTVNAAGLVTPHAVGLASVTVAAQGRTTVIGTIRLRVVQADLATVSALAGDVFAGALVAALSAAKRPAVQIALGSCGTGASTGNVVAILKCAADVRAEAASASDATDRALLAVLMLYGDQIARLLRL